MSGILVNSATSGSIDPSGSLVKKNESPSINPPNPPPAPEPEKDGPSIWWLEANCMIASMNVDNFVDLAYLKGADADSQTVNQQSKSLQDLNAKIESEASSDKSLSPWKVFAMVGIVLGVCLAIYLTGGVALAPAIATATGAAAATVSTAVGTIAAAAATITLGSTIAAGAANADNTPLIADEQISSKDSQENTDNQNLYNMLGTNAAQQENLDMQLGPSAQSQKNQSWAQIISSVIQAQQQTNTIRLV